MISLDLSQCLPELHLTVRACPRLSRIRLPGEHPTGATVHIDFGERIQKLQVIGRLSHLDACWTGGRFATSPAASRVTLDNAYIGPWEDMTVFASHELVALQGQHVSDSTLHLAGEDVVRELIILDCPTLVSIEGGPHLEALTLYNPTRLERIALSRGVGRLRIDGAPCLSLIQGRGHSGVLVNGTGAASGLRLEDEWRNLSLTESHIERLEAPGVTGLELISCSQLRYVNIHPLASSTVIGATRAVGLGLARLRLDESAVRDLAWRAREGDTEACQLLLDWCAEADNRKAWLAALTVLAELADQGFDPAWLWELRCRMHARCNRPRNGLPEQADPLTLGVTEWHWELPRDLAQRGWDADLRLWVACRELPQARALTRLLRRTNRPRHLATLARYLINESENTVTDRALYRCLRGALRRARPLADPETQPGLHFNKSKAQEEADLIGDYLDPVLQCAVARRDRSLAEALHHYINQRLEPGTRTAVLARLLKLGLQEARQSLMQIVARARASGESRLAADAMGLALSPVEHALFDRGSPM